jgi:hypothetical protein
MVAVSVTLPPAIPVKMGELSDDMVAMVVSLTLHAASGLDLPWSSTAVNCCAFPSGKFTLPGVIWSEFGAGKGTSKITWRRVAAIFPAWSEAVTITRLTPGLSEMLHENAPELNGLGVPLQVTPETAVSALVTVPATTMVEEETANWSAGEATAIVGGVLSMLRFTLLDAVFPAASVVVPLMTWLAPSELTVCGPGQETTVELPTAQVNVTTTIESFQPLELGGGDAMAVITGGIGVAATANFTEVDTAPSEAVIVALPLDMPAAEPVVPIVATPVLDDVQWTDEVTSCVLPSEYVPTAVNCWVPPTNEPGAVGWITNDIRGGGTTLIVVELLTEPMLATTEVEPWAKPIASPVALIVATEGALEIQVTDEVRSCVLPSE